MDLWDEIKQRLTTVVTAEGYQNWINRTTMLRVEGTSLWVRVPDDETKVWMETEYGVQVAAAIRELRAPVMRVVYETQAATRPVSTHSNGGATDVLDLSTSHLSPKLTFETFVVGTSNQLAHAASWAVATQPSKKYNPLFIYGGVGMGKTHLMHAIGRTLVDRYMGLRVVYTTGERFMNFMVQSMKADRMPTFQRHFRSADVLLVDDVHNLANKDRTQEEFFYTFNELHEHGKQIVLSSDSPPKSTAGLVERLRSRFEWGLMVDIQPPDLETKMAILDKKAEAEGIDLPDDVRIMIATRSKSNVRELEGALVKLNASSSMTGEPISLAMAEQVLRHLTQGQARRVTIESIIRAVADRFALQAPQLKMKSNERKIAYPRQVAMYLAKDLTGHSLPEIGRAFGGKHHTTVLHSIHKIEALRLKDQDLNTLIHSLSDSLTS